MYGKNVSVTQSSNVLDVPSNLRYIILMSQQCGCIVPCKKSFVYLHLLVPLWNSPGWIMFTIAAPSIIRISTWGFSTDDCAHELRLTRRSDFVQYSSFPPWLKEGGYGRFSWALWWDSCEHYRHLLACFFVHFKLSACSLYQSTKHAKQLNEKLKFALCLDHYSNLYIYVHWHWF